MIKQAIRSAIVSLLQWALFDETRPKVTNTRFRDETSDDDAETQRMTDAEPDTERAHQTWN